MHRLAAAAATTDALVLCATWLATVATRAALSDLGPLLPLDPTSALPLLALVGPVWLAALSPTWAEPRHTSGLPTSVVVAALSALALVFLLQLEGVSRTLLVGFAAASLPALYAGRTALRRIVPLPRRRLLLIGHPAEAAALLTRVRDTHDHVATVAPGDDPSPALGTVDTAFATSSALGPDVGELAAACDAAGVPLSIDASFLGPLAVRREGDLQLLVRTDPMGKRVLDLLGATFALVLAAPLLPAIALAIRVQDGGPALFVQERSGRGGKRFRLYKFRTMVPDAEDRLPELAAFNETAGPTFKMRGDPRVTAVGAFLRRWSLDELPQLVNVLRGEMSLVGPRPPLPHEVSRYARWQLRRLAVRPGLTGLWQVSGRSRVPFDTGVALDLQYIDQWSLWLDLRVLARTVRVVLVREGAW